MLCSMCCYFSIVQSNYAFRTLNTLGTIIANIKALQSKPVKLKIEFIIDMLDSSDIRSQASLYVLTLLLTLTGALFNDRAHLSL